MRKSVGIALLSLMISAAGAATVYAAGWQQGAGGWWYEYEDGSYAKSGIRQIGDQQYAFDQNGYMLQGWQYIGFKWYYFEPEGGAMAIGWKQVGDKWYYLDPNDNGAMYTYWLDIGKDRYYLDENGVMVRGWKKIGDDWYYFHEDGGMNLGKLELDNAVYTFSGDGALTGAAWRENTGGGAYPAGCYDDEEQALFDQLGDEKKEQYFDAHPDREEEYDGDSHTSYDRYAGFKMDVKLNKIAAGRLEAAMEKGYADGRVTGEGSIEDCLAAANYRRNSTCQEIYVRNCEDADEAFDKVMEIMDRNYASGKDRRYTLDYYRYMGMAHCEKEWTPLV